MKVDVVELLLFCGIFVCIMSALGIAFYPVESAIYINEHVPQAGYPMDLPAGAVSAYSDGNETATVTIDGIRLVQLQPLCTGSMQPVFGCNSTVFAEPVTEETVIHEQDIIAYEADDGMLISHRAVGYDSGRDAWIMKGDANPIPDNEPVSKSRMRYRIVAIIYTVDSG